MKTQKALLILLFVFYSSSAQCFEGLNLFGRPGEDQYTQIKQSMKHSPATNHVSIHRQSVGVTTPLIRNDQHKLIHVLDLGWMRLNGDPRLPDESTELPQDYWKAKMGLTYTKSIDEKRSWGVSGLLGSASDKPFSSLNVLSLDLTALYRIPSGEKNEWLFLLNYSNLRPVLNHIPLPGVAYVLKASDELTLTLGLPVFGLFYRPVKKFMLNLITMGPWFTNLQAIYFVLGPIQSFFSYETGSDRYLKSDSEYLRQLFYVEHRTALGVRSPISQILFAEIQAGQSFGRELYEGTGFYDAKTGKLKLNPNWFVGGGLSARF